MDGLDEIKEELLILENDENVKVVILTGKIGDDTFIAGMDLVYHRDLT